MLITSCGLRSVVPARDRVDRVPKVSRLMTRALHFLFVVAGLTLATAQATPPSGGLPPQSDPPADWVDNECNDLTYTELAFEPGDWTYHVNDETYGYSASIPSSCWFYGNLATDLFFQAELWCDGEMLDAWWSSPDETKIRTAPPDPQLCTIKSGLFSFENEQLRTDPIPGTWGGYPFFVRFQRIGFVGNVSDIPSIELLPWFYTNQIIYGDFPEFDVALVTPGASVARVDYYSGGTSNLFYPRMVHDLSLLEEFGEPTHSSFSPPFRMTEQVSWRPAPGINYMVAKVTDSLGRSAWSDLRRFRVVQNTPPKLRAYLQSPNPVSAPATVSVHAEATDGESDIDRVEFYIGASTTPAFVDTEAFFDFSMPNLAAGNYSVWVVAYDDRGLSTRVGPVSFTVTNAAPVVAITAPADGATAASPASFVLTATATDETGIQRVEFYDNGTNLIGTDTTAPYSINWSNIDAGVHRVTAKAYDLTTPTAQMTESAPVSLYVTNKNVNLPPRILVTAPVPGAIVKTGSSMTITANARDFDTSGKVQQIRFFKGNETSAFATYAGLNLQQVTQVSSAFLAPVTPGLYALRAQATDKTSPIASDWVNSAVVTVNVVSNLPPTVSLIAPEKGASFVAPSTMWFSAAASDPDGTVAKIEYFRGDRLLATLTTDPAPYNWAGPSQAGSFEFWARATDNLGATTDSERVQLTVATAAGNTPPAVALVSPLQGAAVGRPATFKLQATASDANGTISAVEFFEGPLLLGTDSAAPYEHQLLNVPEGAHTYWARAIDNQGSSAESLRIPVYVTGLSPTIRWIAPAAGTLGQVAPVSINAVVDATDSDGSVARVEFWNGSTLVGESTEGPGFAFTYADLPAGNHQLKAIAFDGAENFASTAVIPLTVAVNQIPTLSVALPAQNASYSELQRISTAVTAADGNAPFGSVKRVEYVLDGNTQSPYVGLFPSFGVDFPAPAAGAHQLLITAYDDKNAASIPVTRTFTVIAAEPPLVQMAAPASSNADGLILLNQPGQNLDPDKVKLSATVTDPDAAYGGQIQSVQFFGKLLPNGQPFIVPAASGTTAPNYRAEWQLQSGTSKGDYQFWVKAVDNGPTGAPLRNTTEIAGVSVPIRLNVAPSAVKITRPIIPSATGEDPVTSFPRTVLFAGGNTQLQLRAEVTDANGNVGMVKFVAQQQSSDGAYVGVAEVDLATVTASSPLQTAFETTVNLANFLQPSRFPIVIKAVALDTRDLPGQTLDPLHPSQSSFLQCGGAYVPCTNTSVAIAYVPAAVVPLPCGGPANSSCDGGLMPEMAVPSGATPSWTRIEGERPDIGGQGVGSFVRNRALPRLGRDDAVMEECPNDFFGNVILSRSCVLADQEDGENYRYSVKVLGSGTAKFKARMHFPPPESLIVIPTIGGNLERNVAFNVSVQISRQYFGRQGKLKVEVFADRLAAQGGPLLLNPCSSGTPGVPCAAFVENHFQNPYHRNYSIKIPASWPLGEIKLYTVATLEQPTSLHNGAAGPTQMLAETGSKKWSFNLVSAGSGATVPEESEGEEDPIRFESLTALPPDSSLLTLDPLARVPSELVSLSAAEAPPAGTAVPCEPPQLPTFDPEPSEPNLVDGQPVLLADDGGFNRGEGWFIYYYCDIPNVVPGNYWADFRRTHSGVRLDYLDMGLVQGGAATTPSIEISEPVAGQHFSSGQVLTVRALISGVAIGTQYRVNFLQKLAGGQTEVVDSVDTTSGVAVLSWTLPTVTSQTTLELGVQLTRNGQLEAWFPTGTTPTYAVVIDPPGNNPPQISVAQPQANAPAGGVNQPVTLMATVVEPEGQAIVQPRFLISKEGTSTIEQPPTQLSNGVMQAVWTPQTTGNYSIVAKAKDATLIEGSSPAREFIVGASNVPVAFISSPTSGTSLAPGATITASITLSGAYSGRKLRLALSNTDTVTERASVLSAAVSSSPATMNLVPTGVPVGSYLLTVQVETAVGSNVFGAKSQSVLIHLQTGVPQGPSIAFQNPLADGWVFLRGETIQLKAALSFPGGSFEQVWAELFVNGQSRAPHGMVFDATSATLNANWTAEASTGTQELRVHARHSGGQVLTATRTFTVAAAGSVSEQREYIYDDNERLCKVINPESGATLYAYDEAGNIAWTLEGSELTGPDCETDRAAAAKDPDRVVRVYQLNSNRVALIDYPAGTPDISYTYEADGALDTVTTSQVDTAPAITPATTWTYDYNNRRMPTVERMNVDGKNFELGYGYNANGHLDRLRYPDTAANTYSVDYAPDALGRATHVRGLGAQTMYAREIKYHPNGVLKQFTYGNNVKFTLEQNERQLPESSISVRIADNAELLADHYTYDANGNVSTIVDTAENHTTTRGMEYDDLDRLTLAIADGLWGEASYIYDGLDNLRSATQGGRQYRYNYNEKFQLSSMISPAGTNPITLGYNPVGDVTTRNGAPIYDYDAAHRLRAVQGIASYVYDAHGRRVRETKQSNGQVEYGIYSQSGQKLFKQIGNDKTRNIYLGGSLIAITVNGNEGTSNYTLNDALGSVVADVTNSGTVTARYRYAPYGESLGAPLGIPMDGLGYTGHDMDADTGLTYMQQRYYDPVIGRFLSLDPVGVDLNSGGNFNRYWYANNNPYRFVDPDGRQSRDFEAISREAGVSPATVPLKSPDDWLHQPLGAALAAVLVAPVAIEAGMAALANPATANAIASTTMEIGAGEALGGASLAAATLLAPARAARNALAQELAPLGGKAPATVTAGINTTTGAVAARACGGGNCAETNVVNALGGNPSEVKLTEAMRPRTGAEVPVCQQCEATYGRDAFPPETQFKSDK